MTLFSKIISTFSISISLLGLSACTLIDKPVDVVKPFEIEQYIGTWYEIARLDHSFERNMSNVTAQYNPQGDKLVVINRGYKQDKQRWDQATGKAYFINGANQGLLTVSFFGPFYGAYQIHDIVQAQNGRYTDALVIGPNDKYAWILSRTPSIDAIIKQRFMMKLSALTIDPNNLIWVDHTPEKDDR
ncbi:lipocalin family protein [Shewanella sp. S1-49-MNA-CIBAN-0167]|uniref:lipocalin family protein n=1 Tax=Shewanella sp. S1-49-MNA-CIBAN-0167 TaxID=3140468 RepID=UPI0033335A93